MDNLRILVQQYLRAAWRRRWMGVIVAWLICGLVVLHIGAALWHRFVEKDEVLSRMTSGHGG